MTSSASPRREWLKRAAGAVAAAAAAPALAPSVLQSQPPAPRNPRVQGLLDQLSQQTNWKSLELRLLRRISLGMNATEVARVKSMGYSAYLEEQLNYTAIDDSACDARIQRQYATLLALTPQQARDIFETGSFNQIFAPHSSMIVERAIFTKRQLYERMVEFWNDHFHVPLTIFTGGKIFMEADVIRPHALGKFGDLVRGSMRNVSMSYYLDQVYSTRFGVNENYARELMELHTVGWDGGYTQKDVAELARILTGWTTDGWKTFRYRADNHDFGAKTCMGMNFPARAQQFTGTAGMDEGIAFAEMLINHPSTKRFIATKLLRWFVRPDPSEAQIQSVINAYTATDGDIRAMLRVVLSPANLAKAPARQKRPFHYLVSTHRGTGANVIPVGDFTRDFVTLTHCAYDMGQGIGFWQTPDGYPDRDDFWAGLVVDRWRNVNLMVQSANTNPGWTVVDLASFSTTPTADGVAQEINRRLFGGEMSAELLSELRTIMAASVTPSRVLDALRLAVMAPEFHFY